MWTLTTDQVEYLDHAALLAGNRVLVKVGGALQARDVASGKVVWKVQAAGRLLAASEHGVLTYTSGQLLSRRLSDGRTGWKVALPEVRSVQVSGQTLYVTTAKGATALDAGTGKTRWQYADSELTEFGAALSGVVFWKASKGEPHFPAVVALDGQTGKRLYGRGSTSGPLAFKDGQVLFKDFGAMGPDDRAQWQWVDLRSGTVSRTVETQADFQCPGTGMYQYNDSDGFYAPNFYYLRDRCGTRLNQFADDGQPSKTPLAHTRTFADPDDGQYVAGPVNDLLVLISRGGEVRLLPTAGRSPVNLNGVDMPTGPGLLLPGSGPVSRLDVMGNMLYVGRVGGSLLAFDTATKKALYATQLPWSGFGESTRSSGYVLLTRPGAVAVVKEPR